jgi:hypothetical protein
MTNRRLPIKPVKLVNVVEPANTLTSRLWRLRRRHDHLDASIEPVGDAWDLTFALNDRALLTTSFSSRDAAVDDAEMRKRELVRAGWNQHW